MSKLNRSRKWPPAKTYAEAREIAIKAGVKVQRKVVR